jgi:hypothetical protein
MAAIVLPTTPSPLALAWQLLDFGNTQKGALGGATQRINRLGNRWSVNVTMPPLTALQARNWSAGLTAALQNGVRLAIVQPDFVIGAPGTVLVNGAGQAGPSLVCNGATPGYIARIGQWASVTTGGVRYLYQIAADATASGGGALSLTLTTPLRVAHANNDPVNLATPEIEGLIVSLPAWGIDVDRLTRGFSFTIEEAR